MARASEKKVAALEEYLGALRTQFPSLKVKPSQEHSDDADFLLYVEAPEDIVLDVVDATASLSYDSYVNHHVNILATVSSTG